MRRVLIGLGLFLTLLPQTFAEQLPTIDPNATNQRDQCLAGGASCAKTKITVDDLLDLEIVDRDQAKAITSTDGKPIDRNAALPSIDINVLFDYDSDAVRPDQLGQLAQVANSIAGDSFSSFDFVVLGHTDAKGTLEHNLDLSQRRAQSVAYVVAQFAGVPIGKFKVRGLGFSRLANPDDPLGAENRRVQLVVLPRQ